MNLNITESSLMEMANRGGIEAVVKMSDVILKSDRLRKAAIKVIEKKLRSSLNQPWTRPPRLEQEKVEAVVALLHTVDRALGNKNLAPASRRAIINALTMGVFLRSAQREAIEKFKAEHNGYGPPATLVISPGKGCNLHCVGCYASSGAAMYERLPWEIFDRIITEAETLWGARLITISGGEPFVYRDKGKGLIEAAAKHQDSIFMTYTNGTLIDKKVAARLAEVGNILPAISVEGLEEKTDARRGEGVFKKILQAMDNLNEVGVPFGVSITATRYNWQEIYSDEFIDLIFKEKGAYFAWVFHYMPIGRGFTVDLMPTPEQRLWMWRTGWEKLIMKERIFIADFWAFGHLSDGCISSGRENGYLYIDWNGNVMPCVFFPYSPINILDVYKSGGTLNDVLEAPLFKHIREWQWKYEYGRDKPEEHGNVLMPCPIRDHHALARHLIDIDKPKPEDENAAAALKDPEYYRKMVEYDERLAELTDPIWVKEYGGRSSKEADRIAAPFDVEELLREAPVLEKAA